MDSLFCEGISVKIQTIYHRDVQNGRIRFNGIWEAVFRFKDVHFGEQTGFAFAQDGVIHLTQQTIADAITRERILTNGFGAQSECIRPKNIKLVVVGLTINNDVTVLFGTGRKSQKDRQYSKENPGFQNND